MCFTSSPWLHKARLTETKKADFKIAISVLDQYFPNIFCEKDIDR